MGVATFFLLAHFSTCLPELIGPDVFIGEQGIMGIPYLSTCRPVKRLTGLEVNIGVLNIIGIPYSFTCRPVNLSLRVDRSRDKYRKT